MCIHFKLSAGILFVIVVLFFCFFFLGGGFASSYLLMEYVKRFSNIFFLKVYNVNVTEGKKLQHKSQTALD